MPPKPRKRVDIKRIMGYNSGMERSKSIKKFLFKYAVITLGCIIYSVGVAMFLDVADLAAGGVTGIAIFLNYLIPKLDTGILIIIINVPLFILGAIFFGRNFALSTMFSTLLSSGLIELWHYVLKDFLPFTDELLISAVIGGGAFGMGLGIIFRMGSSTGGTDVIVKILHKKFRFIKTGVISMIIDITIVCISAIIYRNFERTFYTVVSIIIFTLMFDFMLYGGNTAKFTYIITDEQKSEEIIKKILEDLNVGATYVDGKGGYTKNGRRIIMCAIKNMLYPRLRDAVYEIDPDAFMIVTSAKEIYGEGYKTHSDGDL